MSFQDRVDTVQSRLHLGNVKPSVLVMIIVAISVTIAVAVVGLSSLVSGESFAIEKDESHTTSQFSETSKLTLQNADDPVQPNVSEVDNSEPVYLCVHVSGCVLAPGVYYLEEGSRVHRAIEAAGGFTDNAQRDYVNEARLLVDGEHIVIPSIEEIDNSGSNGGSDWVPDIESSGTNASFGLININTADLDELMSLSGIGEATANKIIADREANGLFGSIEDLKRVSGIGEKKFEAISSDICI